MASLNRTQIIGNVGADPEMRSFPNGDPVCNLRIATTEHWKDKEGELKSHTEWHRVTLFRRDAENAGKLIKTGAQIFIEGKNRTRKYTDKDGIERTVTEIHADSFQLLGPKPESASKQEAKSPAHTNQAQSKPNKPAPVKPTPVRVPDAPAEASSIPF